MKLPASPPVATSPARSFGRVVGVVTSLLVTTALLGPSAYAETVRPAHPPVWDTAAGGERYVAFGDSFVSGPGIAPQRATCGRSEKNFPTLVATALKVNSFVDASCGGATTTHFWNEQTNYGVNAPQLDALTKDTTLVTFGTMGGNDIGLVQLAAGCASTACVPPAGTDPLAEKFAAVRVSLTDALAETRRRAPAAEVVVVGYGTYLPKNGCPDVFGGLVDSAEANYVQGQIDRLSDLLEDVAKKADVLFIDQREIPGAVDRTVCASPDRQWLRALNTYDDGSLFHPSACGMDATAQHVVRELRRADGQSVPAFDSSCVSAGPVPAVTPSPTPTPKPAQPTQPAGPTKAQRLKALKAKASSVRLAASCVGNGPTSKRSSVRLVVTGGKGAVKAVTFKAGTKRVAVDRKKPWATTKKASVLRKHLKKRSATLSAVVTLRDGSVTVTKTVKAKRPRCVA